MTDAHPDPDAVRELVRHLFGGVPPATSARVEVAWSGPEKDPNVNRAKLFDVADHAAIVDKIVLLNQVVGQNVYLAAGLRNCAARHDRRNGRDAVVAVTALWTDFDEPGAAEAAVPRLEAMGLLPTLVVITGRHPNLRAQFWFLLDEPTTDLDRVEKAHRRLVQELGGDKQAVNADRLMRAGGTVAWPKKVGRITEPTAIMDAWPTHSGSYTFAEVEERLDAALGAVAVLQDAELPQSAEQARRLTQGERIERSQLPGQWHENVRDYVAHMVQGGANLETILSLAGQFQMVGYTLAQTEKDMRQMAEGAFAKFAPTSTSVVSIGAAPGLRPGRDGRFRATLDNVTQAIGAPDFCGYDIRLDQFRGELMLSPAGRDEWLPFEDADGVMLRTQLSRRGFAEVSGRLMSDALTLVAKHHAFDSAILWLDTTLPEWDGVPRVERFLSTYFAAADTAYARAVSRYMWTAMAGRVLSPGIKADMVPTFVGAQGCGKSTGVAALVPAPELFAELSLSDRDADISRSIRGKLVCEFGELRGLKSRDAESIKGFISSTIERWRPLYREYETTYARRCLFIGTTNDDEFLGDPTGERRWLPVRIKGKVDVEAIKRDRDQLWAEGRVRYVAGGIAWQQAEELARAEHAAFKGPDPLEDSIHQWLHAKASGEEAAPIDRAFLRTSEIIAGVERHYFGGAPDIKLAHRIGRIMRSWGFSSVSQWVDGRSQKVWVKPRDAALQTWSKSI